MPWPPLPFSSERAPQRAPSTLDPALLDLIERWARGLRRAASPPRREWLLADADRRTRFHLDSAPGHHLWIIRWPAGALAPLHDHGAAGAVAMLEGELCERIHQPGAEPCRIRRWTAEQIQVFGPEHRHEVFNERDQPAYSLHLQAREAADRSEATGSMPAAWRSRSGS